MALWMPLSVFIRCYVFRAVMERGVMFYRITQPHHLIASADTACMTCAVGQVSYSLKESFHEVHTSHNEGEGTRNVK